MTNEEKINYLNNFILTKSNFIYGGPKYLYKYRPFDEFTFDMLENEYVYLCPAEKEDDETECLTTVDFDKLLDLETNNLKRECMNQIIELIRPYSTEENYENAKNRILAITRKDGTVPANFMLDLSLELQEMAPDYKDIIVQLVNWIVGLPEMLDKPEISSQLKPLFLTAYNARKETGICSLAESNNIEYMWDNYARNSSGYCIEYDLSDYEYNVGVLPVIYQDERETNIIMQLVGSFIGQMITGFSNGQIQADSSHFIRLFLTKYTRWAYQNEWRLLGKANDKMKAPKIKRIYLGENVSEDNRIRITAFCDKAGIEIVNYRRSLR
jgi:hypothetical protein